MSYLLSCTYLNLQSLVINYMPSTVVELHFDIINVSVWCDVKGNFELCLVETLRQHARGTTRPFEMNGAALHHCAR